uniref:TOG domain-containing protein n=1 Tax=Oryza punctata TaxID=4537 RepID=A0A0E0JQ94_ORYPU
MSAEDERLLMEAKRLPWDERLQHKSWEVRRDANIDLAALCDSITDPKDARLRELGPLFQNSVADWNAPVREKALDALLAFQRASDADASRYAKEICDAIVAKCLTGRPRVVEKAQATLLLWVGLDAAEVFVNDGCNLWKCYKLETTPTPYLKQVLNDLHVVVRGLKEDNTESKASLVSARAQIDKLMIAPNAVADWRRKLKIRLRSVGRRRRQRRRWWWWRRRPAMSTEDEKLLKEAKKLPWDERLQHKNWKVRNDANIDLAALCDSITDPKDARLREFGPLFKKTVADSNAPVQEKALDALLAFQRAADADASRYAKEVCDAIVAKCLTGRPKTVEKAQAAFLLWVELEAAEESMEKAVKNKVAKAVVPAIDVMFQALSEFGAKVVTPKKILKMLPELFDHPDQNVRASSKGLTLELCRWIGKEPVKAILFEKMRDTMKKELEAELANVSGIAKPTRKIRSEQEKELEEEVVPEAAGTNNSEEAVPEAPMEIDEYDLVDPVDILTPLEKSGFWDGVKATKWSERRDAVAELTKLASTKKIAPGDFHEICRTLKKLVTDVNLAVSVEATQAIGNLAKGLRTHFSGNSREKLKEKKPTMTEALSQTLQAMHKSGCITLLDVIEDVRVAVKNKVPLVRSLTLNWVAFCIETSNKATVLKLHKEYVPICMEMVGMKPLERSLEKLDDVRKKKLSDMIGSASDTALSSGTVAASNTGVGTSAREVMDSSSMRRSAASMLSGKKPVQAVAATKKSGPAKSATAKKTDGGPQSKASAAPVIEDVEPSEMSLEEIEEKLNSVIKTEIISQLKSTVWKERLEAISMLKQEVESLTELDKSAELLVRLLSAVPGWSEKNVQVQQQVIEVITYIASTLYKIMKEHKNPKVLSEGILWMVSAIEDFGISNLKLKDTIDFCKDIGLQSSAAATRNATIKLIGVLHKFVGPDIKGFLSDVKPALLSTLDAEYEKNPFEGTASAPKRTIRAADAVSSASSATSDGLPREDISAKITPTLLKNLGSPDWKLRLESIDAVNKIVEEAHKRIQPTGTVELFTALRARLYDSNKNLVMATLSTIGGLASAMGPAVEKSSKGILADVLKCFGDNKKHMRECTLTALDSWVAAAQLDKMVPYITVTLGDQKTGSEGRKDLFDWLSKHVSNMSDPSEALPLLKPSASSLMDKSSEVRKAAESFMNEILKICGQDVVAKNLKDLPSPTLAIVAERLKLPTVHEGFSDSVKMVTTSMSLPSKAGSKNNKHGPNDRGSNVSKAVSQRGIPARSSVTMISSQDSLQSQALFNIKDSNKEERERRVLVRKFKFEEPRREQIDELKIELFKHFREDVSLRLWNSDFKRQIDGIELLQKALPSSRKEVIELLDILLRWFVLRFCESNTTCLLKVLDFLPELFDVLKDQSYMLTEAEAAIFLPCLVEKSGHNIEKVREKMGELIKQMVNIYSLPKLLPYILEGLRSKNNRTRIECVDIIGYFMDHHGTEVSGLLKNLPSVAALTAERDGEIRKAALNTLATAYKNLGDDVWRYVGKLSDAQRSMLDDRFKWKAREMDKRREGRPGDARAALRRSVRENGSDIAEQSGEVVSRSMAGSMISRENFGYSDAHMVPRQMVTATPGPADWREALDIVALGLPEQSVEGMKVICHELTQAVDPESSVLDDLIKEADRLVSCLAVMVPKTFNFSLSGASSRSCKYVLNTLMQTFQIKRLAHAVKEGTLDNLITELLLWLLDERVPLMDDGSQLLKALNVLMLKILDNAERTSSFIVLINLLRPLDPSRWPSPTPPESLAVKNQKFSDLVVKCLIKLTKVLQSTIYEVDLDRILQSIHIYLQELGMEEIRRRAGADDKPLRMVKTVLHELVKLRGTAIKGHLSMVPIDAEPQPIILAYIDLNLQTLAAARMLTPSGTMGQTHWGDAASNNPNPSTHSTDAQLKQELAAVFKKIGDKQTCTIGLYELYRITQLYPKVDIFAQLQNASEAFRTYIRDGLAQVEKNAAAGRTPSSLPLSTPPPIAPIPSPKFAPSPVHTKSINSKTDSNEDDAGDDTHPFRGQGEIDNRLQTTNLQTDRYQSSGTLDALRERMKSIQAAAVGANFDGVQARPLPSMNGNTLHGGTRLDADPQTQNIIPPMDERALSGLQARMERLKSGSMEPL